VEFAGCGAASVDAASCRMKNKRQDDVSTLNPEGVIAYRPVCEHRVCNDLKLLTFRTSPLQQNHDFAAGDWPKKGV